ncbi:hypothetical protein A9Q95_04805 [Rhodobacterales bacterium 59_46_T64]|nr:hypothetical protein A9Q95_04805 [Rhodobacterales bacterium 59_46_T64]
MHALYRKSAPRFKWPQSRGLMHQTHQAASTLMRNHEMIFGWMTLTFPREFLHGGVSTQSAQCTPFGFGCWMLVAVH